MRNSSDEFYAFVTTLSGNILRFSFGSSLRSIPSIVDLGNLSSWDDLYGIDVVESSSGDWYIIVSSGANDKLSVVSLGSSLSTIPTASEVTDLGLGSDDLSEPRGISVMEVDGEWYGLLSDYNDLEVLRLSFGASLLSTPTVDRIGGFSWPTEIELIRDGGEYYGIVSNRTGSIYTYSFGDSIQNTPVQLNSGNFGIMQGGTFSMATVKRSAASWSVLATNRGTNELYHLTYDDNCDGAVAPNSTSEELPSFSTDSVDHFFIELTAYNNAGNLDRETKSFEVLDVFGPDAVIVTSNQCISSVNEFSVDNTSGDIVSYSWDLDGDGSEDSNMPNPSFSYGSTGDYEVNLSVSNGSCESVVSTIVRIYEVPSASFNYPSGVICTNTEINFTNTSAVDPGSVVSFSWDFDGDGIEDSSDESPTHTFTNVGSSTVNLSVTLSDGCVSESSEVILLQEGSFVDFSWTDNCFEEPISFVNNSATGVGISYSWDFGDGVGTSTDHSPVYTYASGGEYIVSLSVDDGTCVSVLSQLLQVNSGDLASILVVTATATESLPVNFEGIDATFLEDEVVSWNWDFAGLGTSVGQLTNFTFPDPGDYPITLEVTTEQGCTDIVEEVLTVLDAQYPASDFILSESVCREGLVEVTNTSLNADSYEWDFCFSSLSNPVSGEVISGISGMNYSQGVSAEYSEDSLLVLLTNTFGNSLSRLSISVETGLVGATEDLGNFGGLVSAPYAIDIVRNSSDEFYAFVTTLSGNILRFSFGSSLRSIPSIVDLGNLSSWDDLYGIDVVESSSGDWYIIVSSGANDKLSVVSLGSSLSTIPTASEVTDLGLGSDDLSEPRGISVMEVDGEWYGLLSDYNDLEVLRLSFGASLLSTPTVDRIGGFSWPTEIELIRDGGEYYGIVSNRTGSIYTYSFGDSIQNTPVQLNSGNFGIMQSGTFSMATIKRSAASWSVLATNRGTNELYHLTYDDNCDGAVAPNSTSEELPSFSTDSVDHFFIELTAYNNAGNLDRETKSFEVLDVFGPDAVIVTSNQCISSVNEFSVDNTSGDIVSYSWDLDGDGSEDSNEPNPIFDYSTLGLGSYNIRLTVSGSFCNRYVEHEITIYEEPPVPEFTPSVTTECLGVDISFTNSTDESQHPDGVLEYTWDFNGEGTSTEANPSFAFETAGIKDVTVTASIPGCETISEVIQIEVSPGPTSSYTASAFGICAGDIINFADASTGDPVTYTWNFGDGSESTAPNPSHLFTEAGFYNVSLTVQDALGCENTVIQEVAVSSLPEVDFDFEVPCTGELGVQFEDLSTVAGASIATRSWFINDIEVANADGANPNLVFPDAGTFNVRLQTVSTNGCENSYNEDITILESPQPDFSVNIGCLGEVSSFADVTNAPGNPITGWFWTLDNTTYTTQEIDHTFSGTGVFDITLEVTGQNFCSETITRQVEVLKLPSIDFAMNGNCSNELIQFQDQSVSTNDPISSRTWLIDGVTQGTGPALFVENLPEDNYDLTLEVTTASGCVISSTQPITIDSSPEAALSATKDFGVPGESLTFSSISVGASAQQWFVNESPLQTEADQSVTFDDPGIQTVSLVVENQLGCRDSTALEVLIATPEVDLSIGQFQVLDDQGVGNVFVEIINNSNLPVERTEVVIELENQLSVSEEVNEHIGIGESRIVNLNVGIPLTGTSLSLLCVSLNSQYSDYADLTPIDNEKCISIQPQLVVESPFPNPVREETRVKLTAEEAKEIQLEVINSTGKIEFISTRTLEAGLNNIFIRMADLEPGIYFIRIFDAGSITTKRIVKL